jgi:hypothetical protein
MRRDVGYLRHPLAVFLLLVAGARMTLAADWALLVAYPLLAFVGGLVARAVITRARGYDEPLSVSRETIAAGVFPVAFAMSVGRAAGPQADLLLGVVVIGTICLQVVSAFRAPVESQS